jgi:hypothetical protein
MPDEAVNLLETVSRFLLRGDIRPNGDVKYAAFLPPSNLRLSVFRIDNLAEQQIWALAAEKVEPARGPVIGRGNLLVSQITECKLGVTPDEDSASRHADIVNWPEDRALRGTIALELAALASPAKKRDAFG